ncbi:hypothetical protein [Pedobacter sp. MC2016-24]|uniref:hypothetical protein n=1 Tax=Pedobacter sp. MC2016-24 TaxID=2780090 RepID=UPI00187E9DC8|nr:hypothetical protein [Pedobacter sp. MC2016-24]MBE9602664.1 hypothetical protein [Pedobacter sp. MC2016-24]
MDNYEWLDKKTPRSVDQLRLWPANPRLTPDEQHTTLSDYTEDFTLEEADRVSFIDLAKAIAKKGFIPFDPIIVWQSPENEKFYVAEGNRRVLILKLLRNPSKAPRQYRGLFRNLALQIDLESISKVMVNVAPSFEESIWYINQRNNNSSLQRSWGRVQQHRWVNDLFVRFGGDIEKIKDITNFGQGDLESIIRVLKIKDFVDKPEVAEQLGDDILTRAKARNFPVTILERLLSSPEVREKWGVEYDGVNVNIVSNKKSFYNLFADLIKKIVQRDTVYKDAPDRITTRTVTTHLKDILAGLPEVNFEKDDEGDTDEQKVVNNSVKKTDVEGIEEEPELTIEEQRALIKNDPNRAFLIPNFYEINTTNYRLNGLFQELQKIRLTHKNCIGACLRVLLDLSVLNYINNEGIETDIASAYKVSFRDVQLKKRIEFIKTNKLTDQTKKIAARLLDENSEYSLDVLNGYVHGKDIHYLTKSFLNNFWNFLFPLFDLFLDIKEKND